MTYTVMGLDPSLTRTGLARVVLHPNGVRHLSVRALSPGTRRGDERLEWILNDIEREVAELNPDVIGIEGLAFRAKGSSVMQLAGLHYLIRHMLWEMGYVVVIVPPSDRMRYATGAGGGNRAEKNIVAHHARRMFPDAGIPEGKDKGLDEADATLVAAIVARDFRHPFGPEPADETFYSAVNTRDVFPGRGTSLLDMVQ